MTTKAVELLEALQLLAALEESHVKNDAFAYHGFALLKAKREVRKLLGEYAPWPVWNPRLYRPEP
jgi:hypothetical protein